MTTTVETTPSAVIDRVSLVLDAFDGPGRLNLAQIVRRTGLPRSSAHRMLERLVAAALAAPQWTRLRAGDAARRTRLTRRAPGPAAPRRDPPAARSAPRDGAGGASGGPRRLRRGVPGEDRRPDDGGDTHPGRRTPARALRGGRQGDAGLPRRQRSGRRHRSGHAQDQVFDQHAGTADAPNWPRFATHGVAFDREESLPGFGCVAAPIGAPAKPSRRCRCAAR